MVMGLHFVVPLGCVWWLGFFFFFFFLTSRYFFKYILMCHNDKIEVGIYGVLLNVMLK